jgi:hypothetical protein
MKAYKSLLLVVALSTVPYIHFVSTPALRYLFQMQDAHADASHTLAYGLVSTNYWLIAFAPALLTVVILLSMLVDVTNRRRIAVC